MTTISGSHFESQVFDGFYVDGDHAEEHGAVLSDKTDGYRIYYSADGVGIDVLSHKIHIVLTTTNNGTPFHEWTWLYIAQNAVRQVFGSNAVDEDKRVMISRKERMHSGEPIAAFERHIGKFIDDD
ncbi:MAG: hypothetical protein R8J84_02750 [Mariprofundales bacterium]